MKSHIGNHIFMRHDMTSGLRGLGAALALAVALSSGGLASPPPAMAATPVEQAPTLHVLRPIVNAEKSKAEICLEFDHPVVARGGEERGSASLSLKLESQDRKQTFSARAVTYSGNQLCIPGLTHRTTYRLKLSAFKSPSNGKLGSPYSLSFTVPARRPALTFAGDGGGAPLARWRENPVLRSMNVGEAKLELFRIKEPQRMAEAWAMRAQVALAPSETATFAHANGELVWQGALSFDGKPDEASEKQVPLPQDEDPGLYLAVASAPNLLTRKTELVPVAAMWLLRSDLKMKLLQASNGYYALAFDERDAKTLSGMAVVAYGRDFRKVAEAMTDGNGIAFFPMQHGRGSDRRIDQLASVVMATGNKGQVGFADMGESASKSSDYILPPSEASMLVARGAYAPGAMAEVLVAIHDMRGKGIAIKGSHLRVLGKDGGVYAAYPVPETANGKIRLPIPAPVTEGVWPLVWRGSDGSNLAKGEIRVTSVANAPQMQVSADRGRLLPDGEVALTIRSQLPLIQGKARVEWKRAENVFEDWDGYTFGTGARGDRQAGKFLMPAGTARKSMPFVTDENGLARIFTRIEAPDEDGDRNSSESSLWTAILTVEGERGAGAFSPPPLEIPLKPTGTVVGIKPLAAEARFAENSLARFDIVALNGEGSRVSADNLTYRVVEEGRRFDWYQNDGKWDYKPVPQRARVEGGSFSISSTNHSGARLEFPVASGAYTLEIADTEGRVLARRPFSAGWGLMEPPRAEALPLDIKLVPAILRTGSEAKIRLKLDRPALIRTIVADDSVRKVMQETKPKGNVEIPFTPMPDWGRKIKISVEVDPRASSGAIYQGRIEAQIAALGSATAAFAPFTKKEIEESTSAALAAQSVKSGLQASQGSEQKRATAQLLPQKAVSGEAKALNSTDRILLPPQKDWPLAERPGEPASTKNNSARTQEVGQQRGHAPAREREMGRFGVVAFVTPAPAANLPSILSYVLDRPSYTLPELAGTLRTLTLWQDVLEESGIAAGPVWAERLRAETGRMLNRQTPEGGFAAMPGDEPDIASTAAALSALSAQSSPALAPALAHAVDWLSRRLENAWFAENERAERALAYGALARAGKLDLSSLRYFADTSVEKELPPLACANVALAFAYDNDKNHATYWIEKTRTAIAREKAVEAASATPGEAKDASGDGGGAGLLSPSSLIDGDVRPDIVAAWRTLAENKFMNAEQALSEISGISEALFVSSGRKRNLEVMNDLAGGMRAALNRFEPWRIVVRGSDKRVGNGVLVVPAPQGARDATQVPASRGEPPAIRNASGKQIAIELAQWGRKQPMRANLARRILNLDGSPTRGELKANGYYVMLVEGQWPEGESSGLLVADEPGPLIETQTCALHGANGGGLLGWLKEMGIAEAQYCERTSDGVYVRLIAQQKESAENSVKPSGQWRVAWLAKAGQKGSQFLRPPILRALSQGARTYEGSSERINVR